MKDRRALVCHGTLVVATLLTSWQVFSRDHSIGPVAAIEATRVAPATAAKPIADTAPVEDEPAVPVDALSEYLALRADVNPQPRLALIDAWAREVRPGDNIDLLTQALVDSDESVRARAEVLFEREMARR